MTTIDILKSARAAWPALQTANTDKKNAALNAMADALIEYTGDILAANALCAAPAKEVLLEQLEKHGIGQENLEE